MDREEEYLQQQTSEIWGTLHRTFPKADIRVQRAEGSTELTVLVRGEDAADDHSLHFDLEQSAEAVFDAVFSIKALLRHFDS